MLDTEEMVVLRDHHRHWARYYRDCEWTNVNLSRDPKATTYTPEQWMDRAKVFASKRKHHQVRMRSFAKLLKAK
jgi:hypothetical protein